MPVEGYDELIQITEGTPVVNLPSLFLNLSGIPTIKDPVPLLAKHTLL